VAGKPFTYNVDAADEEHIMFQRKNAQHVVTEKQQRSTSLHGEPRIFKGNEFIRNHGRGLEVSG